MPGHEVLPLSPIGDFDSKGMSLVWIEEGCSSIHVSPIGSCDSDRACRRVDMSCEANMYDRGDLGDLRKIRRL